MGHGDIPLPRAYIAVKSSPGILSTAHSYQMDVLVVSDGCGNRAKKAGVHSVKARPIQVIIVQYCSEKRPPKLRYPSCDLLWNDIVLACL